MDLATKVHLMFFAEGDSHSFHPFYNAIQQEKKDSKNALSW